MSELWPKGKAKDMKFGPTMFHVKHLGFLLLAACLVLPFPALGTEEVPSKTYEQAVEELRGQSGYNYESVFETELCSVFAYSISGTPHGAWGRLEIVYKAGSPLGESTVLQLPLQEENSDWRQTCSPDLMRLSEDGSTFTYFYDCRPYGRKVYQVGLASGEVSFTFVPFYQEFVYSYGTVSWNMDALVEGPKNMAVLLWRDAKGAEPGTVRDYELLLFSKTTLAQPKRLILPSTSVFDSGYPQFPTDRVPDQLFLNEDGSVLTYVYSFEDTLFNADGDLLHDAGTYIYRVDTATGELKVDFQKDAPLPSPVLGAEGTTFVDVTPGDWFAPYVNICVEEGLMKGVGGGKFDPNGVMTQAQAVTLAARVHHILNGGDGKLPTAPEDYGILKVVFENGTTLQFDSTQYRFNPVPMSAVLMAELEGAQLEAMGWLEQFEYANATIALGDGESAPCLIYWRNSNTDETKGGMSFRANYEGTEEEKTAFRQIEGKLMSIKRPPAGDWFRNTVYYLETVGLANQYPLRPSEPDKAATRADYVEALSAVAEGLLEPINEIADFPDSPAGYLKELVLSFYNAGILTGRDEFGTFDAEGTLTRAECAAMAARLVRPELRLKFQPTPTPEKYGYTITYLMDDPMQGHTVTGPVLPLLDGGGDYGGILTLDGAVIPWPYGENPISIYAVGDYLWCSFWVDGVEQGGLMDKTGGFALPLQSRFYYAYPVEGGFVASTQIYSGGVHSLLDEKGQVVKELGAIPQTDLWELYPHRSSASPFDIHTWGGYYVDGVNHPVSEGFDWVGNLTDDGQGFVGRDGKIYCIQFFEK